MTILQARGISKRYGGLAALTDVDIKVSPSEFVAVIGPNGAGKSTLLNVLTGLVVPDTGSVMLANEEITRLATNKRIRAGLGRTFQHGRTFPRLSVLENIMVGAAIDARLGERELRNKAMETIDNMGLADIADRTIKTLSYGRRRMVELAPRGGLRSKSVAPGRAGGRSEFSGGRAVDAASVVAAGEASAGDRSNRTQHGHGDAACRTHLRTEFRLQDRGRNANRDSVRSRRAVGLSGGGVRSCSHVAT